MTTSGVSTFNPVRDQIVNGALRLVGAYASTDTPRPEQSRDALEALNMMLKSWQIDGLLWLKEVVYLQTVPTQYQYSIGTGTTDLVYTGASPIRKTTVVSSAAAGYDYFIDVVDDTGVNPGDYLYLFDGATLYKSTVVSSGGGTIGTTLTVSGAVFGTSWSLWTVLPADLYTGRPTRIFSATRKDAVSGYEIPMIQIGREDYLRLPNKAVNSTPVQFYYDPQLATGVLNIWPGPSDGSYILVLNMDRTIQDMVGDTNTFDVPQEWVETIKYCLADTIAPEYGLPLNERQLLNQRAMALKTNVITYSVENAATFFGVYRYGA